MKEPTSIINYKIDGKTFEIEHYSYFNSYYHDNGIYVEPKTISFFLNELDSSSVIFDIGAHIGLYTIIFSQRTENVFAFEPTESFENLLLPNLSRNNITSPKLEKLAMGKESGLKTDKIFRIWGNEAEENQYEFTSIDEYTQKNKLVPTHIKCDVDSFDFEVLLGGKEFLTNHNPTVCVEVGGALKLRGYQESNITNYMKELGYQIVHILDDENYIFRK